MVNNNGVHICIDCIDGIYNEALIAMGLIFLASAFIS